MNADQPARREPTRTLELLWGTAAPPSRGPKPALSLSKIVEKAVEIADDDGLAAVSMRRVAEDLGFTTMSLYRYLSSKDELIELMWDAATAPSPDPDDMPERWRDALTWWAQRNLAIFRQHPWFFDIPISGPPMGPNQVRWMECALRALSGTGLSSGEMMGILQLVSTYTLSAGRLELTMSQAASTTGVAPHEWDWLYGQMLAKVVDAGELPTLARLLEEGLFGAPADSPGDEITFGLDVILDGVEALIERRHNREGTT